MKISFFMLLSYLIISNFFLSNDANSILNDLNELKEIDNFRQLIQEIMLKSLQPYKCVVILTDNVYSEVFGISFFRRFGVAISYIVINVKESDDLLAPGNGTHESLSMAKREDCQLYVVLIANGIQVARFLRFGDRYRTLNTLSKFLLLFDNRLFEKHLFYLWKRIINVVFLKKNISRRNRHMRTYSTWYELTTVPFPVPISSILVPWRLDIWKNSSFKNGAELFRDKTSNLKNETVKIVALAHLPGIAKTNSSTKTVRAVLARRNGNSTIKFWGTEIEILMILSKAMNFKCELYEPNNANIELWGRQLPGGIYTGIIGEMVTSRADIAIGDLYYTPYLLDLMDLSVPYNIECLTFLTPEALTDNSWKTLIRPFKPIMWTGVLLSLFVCALVFHYLAQFHIYITQIIESGKSKSIQNSSHKKSKRVIPLFLYPDSIKMDANKKYTLMKEKYDIPKAEGAPEGLYQFSESINSALYTYSMLLLVSLPKVPTGWSLRVLMGWYLLYCLLVATSYRASMTAILAEPTPKVTINTIEELIASKLVYGGWGEINLHFFSSSSDATLRKIGKKFQLVNDSEVAVNRVADAAFAFYENTYFLKEALVKRQQRFAFETELNRTYNTTQKYFTEYVKKDRSLHIMRDCIINMPVSIGLQKNSPIKPRIDKYVRMVLEAGLIKKWLQDSMQKILNEELQNNDEENSKALMNMKKFSGALVALIIGYFVSIFALLGEILFFNYVVKKDPNYNKYSRNILVTNAA